MPRTNLLGVSRETLARSAGAFGRLTIRLGARRGLALTVYWNFHWQHRSPFPPSGSSHEREFPKGRHFVGQLECVSIDQDLVRYCWRYRRLRGVIGNCIPSPSISGDTCRSLRTSRMHSRFAQVWTKTAEIPLQRTKVLRVIRFLLFNKALQEISYFTRVEHPR